jgi:RNA polymerase sigma factor (sigma-70 family)
MDDITTSQRYISRKGVVCQMENTDRILRVNELAVQAKTDPTVTTDLWEMVEGLIHTVCRRYCREDNGTRHYDYDDFCQNAYLGFVKAIEAYDPERGAFSTTLVFYVRHSCRVVLGIRSSKRDAIFMADSLDEPISDEGSTTFLDTMIDPYAEQSFDESIERVYNSQLRTALNECLEQIPCDHSEILRARYFDHTTLGAIAEKRSVPNVNSSIMTQIGNWPPYLSW